MVSDDDLWDADDRLLKGLKVWAHRSGEASHVGSTSTRLPNRNKG
jgi:hypothetical protein